MEPRWEKPEDGSKWNPGDRVRVTFEGKFKLMEGSVPSWLAIHCGYDNREIRVLKHEDPAVVVVEPCPDDSEEAEEGAFVTMDSTGGFHGTKPAASFPVPERYIIGAMDFDETEPRKPKRKRK